MSDTSETDAAVIAAGGNWSPVLRVVAQRLERERDELAALLAAEKSTRNSIIEKGVKTERERDEARKIAHDLAVIASHCLGSHSFSLSETSERIADTLKRWRSTQPCKK